MLDATLEKKPDGYKMWLSKQYTGFYGTRLQVSYYKRLKGKQAWRPKRGPIETTARLCLCPSEDIHNQVISGINRRTSGLAVERLQNRKRTGILDTQVRADARHQEHGRDGMHVTTDG